MRREVEIKICSLLVRMNGMFVNEYTNRFQFHKELFSYWLLTGHGWAYFKSSHSTPGFGPPSTPIK
jgi:hypothetical protein